MQTRDATGTSRRALVLALLLLAPGVARACPPHVRVLCYFIRLTTPIGDCSRDVVYPNGNKAFDSSSKNFYHQNGNRAFAHSTGTWYHSNGNVAYDPSSGNWRHANGNKAYDKSSGNWYYSNGNKAFDASSGDWKYVSGNRAYSATTGHLYADNGTKLGKYPSMKATALVDATFQNSPEYRFFWVLARITR
jgi:hypothetical protein